MVEQQPIETAAEHPMLPVRVQIGFTVPTCKEDGSAEALGVFSVDVAMPVPQAEGAMGQIVLQLNATEIVGKLLPTANPMPPTRARPPTCGAATRWRSATSRSS